MCTDDGLSTQYVSPLPKWCHWLNKFTSGNFNYISSPRAWVGILLIYHASSSRLLAPQALIYYDYALTFADEIEFIWQSRFSSVTILYVCCRYALVANSVFLVGYLGTGGIRVNPNVRYCSGYNLTVLPNSTIASCVLLPAKFSGTSAQLRSWLSD